MRKILFCKVSFSNMLYAVILLGLFLFSTSILAVTKVYVQNNTSLSFSISAQQTGDHTMDSDEWGHKYGELEPWQVKTKVMWTNRDEGIHWGDNFYLTTILKSGESSINLKIKLRGKWIHSTMHHSLSGDSFSHPWYNDRDWHQKTVIAGATSITIKYQAYFTGHDDDLLYIIQENYSGNQNSDDSNTLDILAYNIYMLSGVLGRDQYARADLIPDHIKGYDTLILSEAFDNGAREDLLSGLKGEYPYQTVVVDRSGSLEDGGVVIVSRWPIEYSKSIVYNDCTGDDCLAAKGAMYARINKNGKIYHLFGTHTQAYKDTLKQIDTRLNQLIQLKSFITSLNIPSSEPVIVGGDLNIDKHANVSQEYDDMYYILDALKPAFFGHPFTYDPWYNLYASGNDREYLDYVLTLKPFLQPIVYSNEVKIVRSMDDFMEGWDLSDHFAVKGHFVFPD